MAHFFLQNEGVKAALGLGTLSSTMRLVAADSADAISPTSVVFTWDDARNDETPRTRSSTRPMTSLSRPPRKAISFQYFSGPLPVYQPIKGANP
jgi:hypothetical protein